MGYASMVPMLIPDFLSTVGPMVGEAYIGLFHFLGLDTIYRALVPSQVSGSIAYTD